MAAEKPNIIYINADDLGVMDVGFMGAKQYHTPHLDQLAKEGMVFTNAYSPAANCAPSRTACLSGQAAPRTGVYTVGSSERGKAQMRKLIPVENKIFLEKDNVTIGGALREAGYVTCQIGKWHVGNDPTEQGFSLNVAGSKAGHPRSYFSPYRMKNLEDGEKGEYLTDRLTDEAISFVKKNRNEAFFLYLPYYTVHTPLQGRKDLLKKYQGKDGVNAHYAAMVEAMDENIGRLMKCLDESGLKEKTLVLFTSDNGGICKISSQAPYRAGKGSYYEGGIREPLVVRWPGKVAAGSRCEVPVIGLDYFPTFLEVAGAKKPEGKVLDGVSLVPLLTGSGGIAERELYWHFPIYLQAYAVGGDESRDPFFRTRPGSMIRDGDWKLHEYFEDGGLELYDLKNDPGERNNLAKKKPEKAEELKKKLDAWRKEMKAEVPTKLNPKYDADFQPKVRKR